VRLNEQEVLFGEAREFRSGRSRGSLNTSDHKTPPTLPAANIRETATGFAVQNWTLLKENGIVGVTSPLHQLTPILANKQRKVVRTPGYINYVVQSLFSMSKGEFRLTRCFCRHLTLASLVLFASAQTIPPTSPNCVRRTVVVTVSDKAGPVTTLSKSNFLLALKSRPLNVVTATVPRQPPRAILVIDLSGSMRSLGELEVVSSLARGFIDAAPSQAPLALLTFADRVKDRLDFSTPKEILVDKLKAISGEPETAQGGRTAVLDALIQASDMFGTPQLGDVIFLISDGGDNRSHAQASGVKRLLLERGVRVYSFIPFDKVFPTEEGENGVTTLVNLSQDTGGRPMPFERIARSGWDTSPKALALDGEMGKYMYVLAASRYHLEVEKDRAIEGHGTMKLRIVGADGKELRNVQALYPHELMACLDPNQN